MGSFGRVLACVRLASTIEGLLGHRSGLVVPYSQSEEHERRHNALTLKPTGVADGERYVQNWEELRSCMRTLLKSTSSHSLEVSKMKLSFRQKLATELSETVFGHESLSRLLADPKLGDDFVLEMAAGFNRYVVRLRDETALVPPPGLTEQINGLDARRKACAPAEEKHSPNKIGHYTDV